MQQLTPSDVQGIVEHLNKEPFRLGLTLVAFDEKANFELLQLLNDVLAEIDGRHRVDLRAEADEARVARMLESLQLLKFPLPRSGPDGDTSRLEAFRDALAVGDRQAVYPILHWAVRNLAGHRKRAYLGRFLAPLQVPQELFGHEALHQLHEHYRQLQEQFKGVHKEVDQLRQSKARPQELRKEIAQLDEEAQQLREKLAALQKKTASASGFGELLAATSALRKEQEEQAKLAERKREQMLALSLAEKRGWDSEQRVQRLRGSLRHETPPEQLLEQLREQVARHREVLEGKLAAEMQTQQAALQRLERALSEPPKTERDVAEMEDEVAALQRAIQQSQLQLAEATQTQAANSSSSGGGEDKLAIFRQHASVQAKKLADREEALEAQRLEQSKLQRSIQEMEGKLAELAGRGGSTFMSREEFKQYANTLRNKTNAYKKAKAELADVTSESVVLHRTEQVLKGKLSDVASFLAGLEAKQGVAGFLATQDRLEDVSAQNAAVNQLKGETLEQISRIVTDINQTLKERKNQLAPQIKELRAVRQRYQELEQSYLERKTQYENTAVGLETERLKLENECHAFQEDCLREEGQYHVLQCQLELAAGLRDKIAQEVAFETPGSDTRLLRDIPSFQQLYRQKVAQQESLTKELRKQQKALKTDAAAHHAQRDMFDALLTLLQCKLTLANGPRGVGGGGGGGLGGGSGMGLGMGLGLGHADIAQFEVGGANVMTLDA